MSPRKIEVGDHSKRQAILYLAGDLFLKQGYAATSLRQISRELNISLGLISYYFPAKRNLAVELLNMQMNGHTDLLKQYIDMEENPILFSGALTKLQYTVFYSPVFRDFYLDALREDLVFDEVAHSGIHIYSLINKKYNLGLSDDYLTLYGNFISASLERTLVLYRTENPLIGNISIPDMLFMTYMGRFYGSEEFLEQCCQKTDVIVQQIVEENPRLLKFWYDLRRP